MVLIRSMFWLAAAYLVVGPNANISGSLTDFGAQAFAGTQEVITNQVNNVNCTTLQCAGAKAVISAGLNSVSIAPVSAAANKDNPNTTTPTDQGGNISAPIPHPRLTRAG